MNTNNTQIGHSSSESLLEHYDDQLLSNESVITSQPSVPFTTANMIRSPYFRIRNNVPANNHLTRAQLSRRRRRQRQRERRKAQRERQQQEAQRPRYRRKSKSEREYEYWQSLGFEYYMEENMSPLLEAYDWEKMNPTERQDRWEQDHLNELEQTMLFEQPAQQTLVQDELEQLQNIATAQTIIEEEEERERERNNEQLLEFEQSEYVQFLLQQMALPHIYYC